LPFYLSPSFLLLKTRAPFYETPLFILLLLYSSQKFWTPTLLSAKYHCYHLHIVNKIPNPSNYTFVFFLFDLQVLCTWQLIWLIPDTQHELLWDYSMCADTSRGTAVQELIAQSLKGALLLLLPSNRSFSFLCYFLHDHKEVTQTQERMKVRILMNSGDTSCLLFPGWILHCSGLRVT
jgi:hypothetical protein